jgi:CRISPR/Cas system CMR subunit Cmr4 (Cas7 group RAMP superfamily)
MRPHSPGRAGFSTYTEAHKRRGEHMARPIMPTPTLKGKAAERFIRELESNKGKLVYSSTKKADHKKLAEIVVDIERNAQKQS